MFMAVKCHFQVWSLHRKDRMISLIQPNYISWEWQGVLGISSTVLLAGDDGRGVRGVC